jgi:hypothetical protein
MSEYFCKALTVALRGLPSFVSHQPNLQLLDKYNKGSIATADGAVYSLESPRRASVLLKVKLSRPFPHRQTSREICHLFEGEHDVPQDKASHELWRMNHKKYCPAPVLLVAIVCDKAWLSLILPVKQGERLYELCKDVNAPRSPAVEQAQRVMSFAKVTVAAGVEVRTPDGLARVLSVIRHWVEHNPMKGMSLDDSWEFRPHEPEPFSDPLHRSLWEYVKSYGHNIHVFKLRSIKNHPQHDQLQEARREMVGDARDDDLYVFKEYCNYLRQWDAYNTDTLGGKSERRAPPEELLIALRSADTPAADQYKQWVVDDDDARRGIMVLRYPNVVGGHRPRHRTHWLQILQLVQAMHNADFVHGDILPRNMVFPTDSGTPAALIDLDFSRKVGGSYPSYYKSIEFEVRHKSAVRDAIVAKEHDVHSLAELSKRYFQWPGEQALSGNPTMEELIRIVTDEGTTARPLDAALLPDEQHATGFDNLPRVKPPHLIESDQAERDAELAELHAKIRVLQKEAEQLQQQRL